MSSVAQVVCYCRRCHRHVELDWVRQGSSKPHRPTLFEGRCDCRVFSVTATAIDATVSEHTPAQEVGI